MGGPLPGYHTPSSSRPGVSHSPSASPSATASGLVEVAEPEGLVGVGGQRQLDRPPEMQVACGGNGIWRGVGGGVFSSLASVSPALSYYIGGTMIWAVTQSIRLLSNAPPNPRTSSSSSSSSSAAHGNGSEQKPLHSTYNYTTLAALSQTGGGGGGRGSGRVRRSDESPSMALISLICTDLISSGKFYCCSVIMAALLCGSSASTFRLLLRHKLHGILHPDRDRAAPMTSNVQSHHNENEIGNVSGHDEELTPGTRWQEQEQEHGKLTAMAVARAFRLQKVLPFETKSTSLPSQLSVPSQLIVSSQLSSKLSQCLMGPYFRQKCEKEMVAVQQPTSFLQNDRAEAVRELDVGDVDDVYAHSSTNLVVTDVAASILNDAYNYRSTSRVLFHSASEIAAQVVGRRDSLDETHQLEVDQSVTTLLSTRSSFPLGVRSSARVLPQALHAVSNVDITGILSGSSPVRSPAPPIGIGEMTSDTYTDTETELPVRNPGSSSLRILVHSLCVALILTGDIEGAGAVAALILQRPDITALCSALNASSRSTLESPASTETNSSVVVTATTTDHRSSSQLVSEERPQSHIDLAAAFEIVFHYFLCDDA